MIFPKTVKPSGQDTVAFLCIMLMLLFHFINNYIVLKSNCNTVIGNDKSYYVQPMLGMAHDISNPLTFPYKKYLLQSWKPPLYYFTAVPFLLIKRDINMAIMSNMVYLAIIMLTIYGTGKLLFNHRTGLLAAFLCGMFPAIFNLSRILLLETALTAMISLTFYLFVLNRFDDLKFSLLTGATIGLGLLTKEPYAIFLIPLLFYFFQQPGNLAKKRILFLCFSLLIGFALALPWYLSTYIIKNGFGGYIFVFSKFKTFGSSHLKYLFTLFFNQLLPFYAFLAFAALIYFILKKKYFIPFFCVSMILFWSAGTNLQGRLILPIFPFIALMISFFFLSITKNNKYLICLFVFSSIAQYALMTYFPLTPIRIFRLFAVNNAAFSNFIESQLRNNEEICFFNLDKNNWRIPSKNIAAIINRYCENKHTNIVVISKYWPNIEYELTKSVNDYEFRRIGSNFDWGAYKDSAIEKIFSTDIHKSSFVIIDNKPEDYTIRSRNIYTKVFNTKIKEFKCISTEICPDKTIINLYKRNDTTT